MPSGVPEIGVRLSASGVADVVAALRRVREEGKAAAQDTSQSFGTLDKQVSSLGSILPELAAGVTSVLAAGAAIEQIFSELSSAGKQAIEYASGIGLMSEKTGIAVGTLSALSLAARETGVDSDTLTSGFVKLSRAAEVAAEGGAKQKEAFADLGITLADLKSKSPEQIFELVAQRVAELGTQGQKANDIITLFGRSGMELVPVLKVVAENGLQGLIDKAKQLGVFLDESMVAQARALKIEMADLGAVVQGVAVQFLSGMLPAVNSLMTEILSVSGTNNSVRSWGTSFGKVLLDVAEQVEVFVGSLNHLEDRIRLLGSEGKLIWSVANPTRIGPGAIVDAYKEVQRQGDKVDSYDPEKFDKQTHRRFNRYRQNLRDAASSTTPSTTSSGLVDPDATGTSDADAKKEAKEAEEDWKAFYAYKAQLAQNDLSFDRVNAQIAEEQDKEAYDAGLMTLGTYYTNRMNRITQAADEERTALLEKRKAETDNLAKLQKDSTNDTIAEQYRVVAEVSKIDEQIRELDAKTAAARKSNTAAQAKATHDAAIQNLEDQKALQIATGNTIGAEETNLQLELMKYSELLNKRSELTQAQKDALLLQYAISGEAKSAYEVAKQKADAGLDNMNSAVSGVQSSASNGSISQISAQAQILGIYQKQIPALRTLGQEMLAEATLEKDPARKKAAQDFLDNLDKTEKSLQNVTTAQTYLFNILTTQGRGAVEDFFTAWMDGSKSFGDALKDMANAFEEMISRMIAKMLIYYALEAIIGWIPALSDSAFAKVLAKAGPFGSFEQGGFTGGKRGKFAGVVHGEEWVANAELTDKYGGLFAALDAGNMPPMRSSSSVSSASMGYIANLADQSSAESSAGFAGSPPVVQVITPPGATAQTKQTKGPGGKSITQIIVSAVHTDIASGGRIAKQMENQYGLGRRGTVRGGAGA